jgi:hypothetical protein
MKPRDTAAAINRKICFLRCRATGLKIMGGYATTNRGLTISIAISPAAGSKIFEYRTRRSLMEDLRRPYRVVSHLTAPQDLESRHTPAARSYASTGD